MASDAQPRQNFDWREPRASGERLIPAEIHIDPDTISVRDDKDNLQLRLAEATQFAVTEVAAPAGPLPALVFSFRFRPPLVIGLDPKMPSAELCTFLDGCLKAQRAEERAEWSRYWSDPDGDPAEDKDTPRVAQPGEPQLALSGGRVMDARDLARVILRVPTAQQIARAAKSCVLLAVRQVPMFPGPLYTEDDSKIAVRRASEVVARLCVLYTVSLRAGGLPQADALALIDANDLWNSVSRIESRFLLEREPDPRECMDLGWRFESIWALLWAVGLIDELDWPHDECNATLLSSLLRDGEALAAAQLRPKSGVLDALDLTMRLHWATRDARLNNRPLPADMDWSHGCKPQAAAASKAFNVIQERHHALSWLVRSDNPDWDSADTST